MNFKTPYCQLRKTKATGTALGNIRAFPLTIILTKFLHVDSLFSCLSPRILLLFDALSNFIVDLHLANFGFSLLSTLYSLLPYMANHMTDGLPRMLPAPSSMSSTNTIGPSLQSDDPNSASYIPRAARMIPTSTTVHTIFIKKICYPFTSRPDELWILERTEDGRETWKPVETFLENMHLTRDRSALRTTANQWRQYYDIPVHSSSPSTATPFPVLPHPEHTNVHVSQPFEAIPDQLHILQSCWGRSAEHHSQGTTTSLFWPPWRSTPPSSSSVTLHRTPLLHLYIILIDQYHLTNRALWICLTRVCNTPFHCATVKKTDYLGSHWVFTWYIALSFIFTSLSTVLW